MTQSSRPLQIAIDGPVASGKSTVARSLAGRLRCIFLDTGALYRAVAFAALQRGIDPNDEAAVASMLSGALPRIEPDPANQLGYRISIDGCDVAEELFSPQVSRAVSPIAAMPMVRARLLGVQREFADERAIIMAGRDIGSVVLPAAEIKFFLTASVESRVERRLAELHAQGIPIERDALRREIEQRDARDKSRPVSPLVKVADAIEIDTSGMTVEEVVAELERLVRERARAT